MYKHHTYASITRALLMTGGRLQSTQHSAIYDTQVGLRLWSRRRVLAHGPTRHWRGLTPNMLHSRFGWFSTAQVVLGSPLGGGRRASLAPSAFGHCRGFKWSSRSGEQLGVCRRIRGLIHTFNRSHDHARLSIRLSIRSFSLWREYRSEGVYGQSVACVSRPWPQG